MSSDNEKLSPEAQRIKDEDPSFDPIQDPEFDEDGEVEIDTHAWPDELEMENFDPEEDQPKVDALAEKLRAILKDKERVRSVALSVNEDKDFSTLDRLLER